MLLVPEPGSTISEAQLHGLLEQRASELCSYISSKIPRSMRGVVAPEDIFQEVCISAFRKIAAFRNEREESFNTWIWRIADRRVVDSIRVYASRKRGGLGARGRQPSDLTSSLVNLFSRVVAPGRTPSSQAAAREVAHEVQVAIARLPDLKRQAIWMRHIEGQSQEEIAMALHKSKQAVNSLLYSGKKQLADLLHEYAEKQ